MKVGLTLLVVFAHSTRMYTPEGVFHPVESSALLKYITIFIYSFHMPAFICLSGMLYGFGIEKGKYTDKKRFLISKIKRLVIPYVLVGSCIVVPVELFLKLYDYSFLEAVYRNIILSQDPRHLWYNMALFLIFCLCILLRKIFLSRKVFINVLVIIGGYIIHELARWVPGYFNMGSAAQYLIFFIVGIYINRYIHNYSFRTIRKIFVVVLILIVMFLVRLFIYHGSMISAFLGILLSIIGASIICDIKCIEVTKTNLFILIKRNSYGIYLFHPMLIYLMYNLFANEHINPYILASGIALIALIFSIILSEGFRRINFGMVIGEN